MRILVLVVLLALLSNSAYAQSVRERLRQVREHEAELLKPKPKEAAPKEIPADKEKKPQCQADQEELDGVLYYNECYCKQLKHSDVETILKGHGLLYQSQGIKEMGEGITHLRPEDRAKYHYTCGVAITWDPANTLKFQNVKECYAFVDTIIRELKSKVDVVAEPLYYSCGEHVQKIGKKPAL